MQIKKIVTINSHIPMGLGLLLFTILIYFFTNTFYMGQPAFVPITVFDIWALHSPPWIWVYVTYYFYLIGIYLSVRNEQILNHLYFSYLVAGLSGAVIFFFFPSTVLRELYPLSGDGGLSESLLAFIRRIDRSLNCAPSMHVTFTTVAAMAFWRDRPESPRMRWFLAVWALMIFYSTMATKQHYFVDVLTGFPLGALIFFGVEKIRFR